MDCPTIEENCREFSFIDELSREAAAELNIYDHVTNVRCLGFSIMANFPDKNFTSQKFVSFFFNVIGEIKTQSSLENIQNMQKQAQEEFENKMYDILKENDNILVKASNGMKFKTIVEKLS